MDFGLSYPVYDFFSYSHSAFLLAYLLIIPYLTLWEVFCCDFLRYHVSYIERWVAI